MPSRPRQRAAVRPVSFIPNTKASMRVSNPPLSVLMGMTVLVGEARRICRVIRSCNDFYPTADAARAPAHGPASLKAGSPASRILQTAYAAGLSLIEDVDVRRL